MQNLQYRLFKKKENLLENKKIYLTRVCKCLEYSMISKKREKKNHVRGNRKNWNIENANTE